MQIVNRLVLAVCTLSASMAFSSCARLTEDREIRVLLVGDSTVTDDAGWGGAIGQFLKPNVKITNRAVGGAASKNYLDDGYLKRALTETEKADYVFIQFGHNDCPGKGPKRETDPKTTYPEYMRRYVEEVRKAGAKPILVTSVARRVYKNGKIYSILAPYAEAVKRVGKEMDVPVIDLHARSVELFERLGDAGSTDLQPEGDRTHFNAKGAQAMAAIIADEMRKDGGELRALLIDSSSLPQN